MKSKKTESLLAVPDETGEPVFEYSNEVAEQLRYMLARIQKDSRLPARLAVTASLRGEGTTFTTHALAAVLAHDLGRKVCVVELNWHAPTPWLQINQYGLADVLKEKVSLDMALLPSGWPELKWLPAGILAPEERAVMARSKKVSDLLDSLAPQFDHLLLDIPAILSTSDAVPLASLADACYLVVRQGSTQDADVKRSLDVISNLPVSGVILNRVHFTTPRLFLSAISGD